LPNAATTWEDLEAPRRGIVSSLSSLDGEKEDHASKGAEKDKYTGSSRPTRGKKAPAWLANDKWDLHVT
jgi:hypothetical protein